MVLPAPTLFPRAEIARGFRDTMPSYGDSLTELRLTVLSEWLSVPSPPLARGPSMTQGELRPTAVDPVCGMKVHPTDLPICVAGTGGSAGAGLRHAPWPGDSPKSPAARARASVPIDESRVF
jgi:hypothetical protein